MDCRPSAVREQPAVDDRSANKLIAESACRRRAQSPEAIARLATPADLVYAPARVSAASALSALAFRRRRKWPFRNEKPRR